MKIIKIKNEIPLYEMSMILQRQTGLSYDIWVDNAGNERVVKHNLPRLKVEIDGNKIPISITENPDVLVKNKNKEDIPNFRHLSKWIKMNKDLLLKFWNKTITLDVLIDGLKKL